MSRRALITGITGQDGSYLAELLLDEGYEVCGMVRRASTENVRTDLPPGRPDHARPGRPARRALAHERAQETEPNEVYNLAAQSFVPTSWSQPVLTAEFTAVGVTRILEAVRAINPEIRFYQASSSEMFGKVREIPQNELTPFYPGRRMAWRRHTDTSSPSTIASPTASSPLRGILFNHESPRRGLEFVTRKITDGVARIKLGLADELRLGNLEAQRDWGFAGDYVRAIWLMLQGDEARDYVIATGEAHSVQEFVDLAFAHAGLDPERYVVTDPALIRPAEVDHLVGDATRARAELGWEPRVSFRELVAMMVDADLARVEGTTAGLARSPLA